MVARDENVDSSRDGSGHKSRESVMKEIDSALVRTWSVQDDKKLGGLSDTRGAADIAPSEKRS